MCPIANHSNLCDQALPLGVDELTVFLFGFSFCFFFLFFFFAFITLFGLYPTGATSLCSRTNVLIISSVEEY